MLDVQAFLREITSMEEYKNQITAVKTIPAEKPVYGDADLGEFLESLLKRVGIEKLYSHQATALEKARRGENLVVVSGYR